MMRLFSQSIVRGIVMVDVLGLVADDSLRRRW